MLLSARVTTPLIADVGHVVFVSLQVFRSETVKNAVRDQFRI